MPTHVISKNNLAELKASPGMTDSVIITLGLVSMGDGKGKLYYWDATSTAPEDTVNYNTVQVTGIATGRYLAVYTRKLNLPHGTLRIENGKKEFTTNNAVVSAAGDCLVNLTYDNTENGVAIFDKVTFDDSKAIVNTTNANEAVSSCRKTLSGNNKQLVHLFYRGSSTTLGNSLTALLGAVIPGLRSANAGTPVVFKVEGE